jgi:hypothetical protein
MIIIIIIIIIVSIMLIMRFLITISIVKTYIQSCPLSIDCKNILHLKKSSYFNETNKKMYSDF